MSFLFLPNSEYVLYLGIVGQMKSTLPISASKLKMLTSKSVSSTSGGSYMKAFCFHGACFLVIHEIFDWDGMQKSTLADIGIRAENSTCSWSTFRGKHYSETHLI